MSLPECPARKWRPKTFARCRWAEQIMVALANGLSANRLHHGLYCFSGTRGVGKTSIAGLFW